MKTTFPEDLKVLSLEDLETLRVAGLEEFDSLYPADGQFATLSDEDAATLGSLTEGLEAVTGELAARAEKTEKLAAMAGKREGFAKITGTFEGDTDEAAEEDEAVITAAADREEGAPDFAADAAPVVEDKPVAFATGEGLGFALDAPLTWPEVGQALDNRLARFNATPYAQAAKSGKPLKTVQSFASFRNVVPEEQMIREDSSRGAVRRAIDAARDQTKLQGGSLIASGGWGAPSQIDYTPFRKLSGRDGIASFPTIGVEHGGLQITRGVEFADVYTSPDFFAFTEADDIAGDYAVDSSGDPIEGTKPVYRITPSTWTDYRLHVDGLHIQAGILQSRGYPEGIAHEVAQVLDAHAHLINAKVIATAVTGSTAVTMAGPQVGSVAPTLAAVELQVLHYRDTHRMDFDEALEAKFPVWIKGAFRADLSRRLGVDLLDVTDARIDAWFRDRGVSLEYVYDWQSLAGNTPAEQIAFPTTVSFLLYAAGTWVKGVSEVISLDTMYDSTLIGTNDYTVMFTEEGWFLAKAGHDSRLITTTISASGATNIGVEIANNGTEAA